MPTLRLDHFITSVDAESIEAHLEEYRSAGFTPNESTVRHDPGLRNGFVRFGPEYLEFVWVEDRALFEAGAGAAMFPRLRDLQPAHRPFGIGIATDDAPALREELAGRSYALPEVVQGVARDAPEGSPPAWSFLPLPAAEGAVLFALTYHMREAGKPVEVRPAPNSTYAVTGLTLAADDPEARARQWRDLLAPGAEISHEGGVHGVYTVQIGPHFAVWMTPEEYQEHYGLSYKASPHPYGEIAVLHLLAADLDKADEAIVAARQAVRMPEMRTGADSLLVPDNGQDGFTFSITQRDPEEWARWRSGLTGEQIVVELG